MDSVTNWKKILLQWVVKCNLLEKTFYSLDQTEVETFFTGFKDLFKEGNICQYKNLSDFFKEEYPLFEPHYDDENTLSSSDHIYVYSLLLHFSCVKVSNAFFQENCKKLDDFAQRNITTFFEKLLNEESLTKQTLRRVIASIHGFTPPSTRLMYTADSPVKTPKKTDISPPTPRSCMLIEKNKKVNFLNAQLDTLSYEKSVLETDLKSCQDKIDKLLREHKKLNQENQDLKNEISSRSKESSDCGTRQHSGEEQIRKLIKKNTQYEEEIAKLREQIDELSLSEEKNILCEKLKKAEIQMKYLQDNVSCLAQQVDDFTQELEQKDRQIKDLSETRDELEQYIKELRSSSSHSGPDLNTSSEFLDMSRVANSSGSLHSPENLGLVVDIKLREKENENEKLREEISAIRIDNSKLSKAMSELTTKYTKLFDVCDDNLNIVDDENPTADNPGNCFIIFSNYMQRFAGKYEENCFELKRVKENERKMEELNLSFASKLEESQNLNVELRQEMDELQSANKTLQTSKANLEMAIVQLENKLENCLNERSKEANALKNLQKEMEKVKLEKQDAENEVEYLTTCLDTKEDILLKLEQENDEKDQMLKESQQKLRELDDQNQNLKQQLLESVMVEKELREQFKDQNHQLSIKLERTQQSFVDLTSEKNYLLTMTQANHKQIDVLNAKIQTLTADQSAKASIISSLESDKASLIASMQEKVDSLKNVIDEYQEGFEMKAREFNELTEKWRLVEAECVLKEQKLQEACQQLDRTTTAFQKVTKNIGHHVNNLKSRLGLDASTNSSSSLDLDDIEDVGFKDEVKCLMDGIVEASDRVVEEKSSVSKKLNELKRLVEELNEEKIASVSNTNAFVEREVALQGSVKKLENDLREKTEHVETLSEKQKQAEEMLGRLETDLKLANEKLTEREEEFERTRSQLDTETSEKLKIQDELKRIVEELNEEKISSVANKNEFVEKERVLQQSIEKLENDLREKREHVETLSEKQKQAEQMLTRLETDLKLANEKLAERQEEFERTKSQLESETSEKLKIQEELQNVLGLRSQLQTKIDLLETTLTKMRDDSSKNSDNLTQEFWKAKSQLQDVVTEKSQVQEELEQLSTEFESTKLQLENEIAQKQKMLGDLTSKAIKISQELESVKQEKEQIRENVLQMRIEFDNELENVKLQSKKLEEANSRLENEVQTLTVELENEALEKSKLKEDFESSKLRWESENTEKYQINESLKQSQSQQEKIKRDLESVKIDLESKIAENLKCREKLEQTNKAIKDLERKCKETSHQRDLESAAKAEMKKLLEASNKELSALRTSSVNSEAEHETLKQKAVQYKKQLDNVNAQLKKEAAEKSELAKALQKSKKQLDELSEQKCSLEAKHKDSTQEVKKYKNLYQTAESELKRLQSEETRLFQEIQTLTATHESQIQKCNKEIDEQKENVSRLIQEIASIRKEKEFVEEEKRILTNRLESKINEQMSKQTSHKSIEEKLQSTERDVLVKLNLLKTEQLKSQDLENQLKKLQIETTKYRETAEANTKRIEKLALNLGEAQAKCQKLKKEADAAQSSLDLLKPSAEMTQRDNYRLNQECRLLKEKLVKLGKSKDQLESKLETLQNQFDTLADEKQILENSESDLKKIKNNLEDKIRKLAKSLSEANVALSRIEQDKVQLNLEVGGLNKQLEENKAILNMKLIEIENLSSNLIEAKGTNAQLLELNEKHQIEAREIHDENSRLNDQLSKLSLRLEITQREHEIAMSELERLKTDVETSRTEREAIEKDHRTAIERLMGVEERRATEVELSSKIKSLEAQITKLTIEKCDMEELRSQDKQMIEELNHNIAVFTAKLQKSRSICEENEKKWAEEREQLLADVRGCEERIKETRFELEGKLEKMKNKMKTLYNDEVAKQKKKQEREVAVYKSEIDSLKAKNDKHEEHIKKLSNQLFRLNENLLEFKKENTFLKTKLKDIESKPRQSIRMRPSSTHQVLSSNLRMEDEEGEIFNNTYLSDLKDGRMSEYFNNDICAQELQYRNSLVPPHLKSTYLAQFDHQMGEEEIRDTPALDDSSSTLLNTGQRKKVSGATSYKRPGPPTPSKNAGRLSFGGIGELNRELLKESHDSASCSSSSTKTPAKFKFFSSKLSMRGDENTPPNKRRLSNLFKKK